MIGALPTVIERGVVCDAELLAGAALLPELHSMVQQRHCGRAHQRCRVLKSTRSPGTALHQDMLGTPTTPC